MNETFPNVTMGSDTWGCYDPVAGVLMADKALKSVWKLFQKLGGTLFDNCVVEKITPNGNETKISLDSGQVLTCKSVVICAGENNEEDKDNKSKEVIPDKNLAEMESDNLKMKVPVIKYINTIKNNHIFTRIN